MYPSRFSYESPKTLEAAIALLDKSNGEAKILAGGQSLVPMLKLRFASPETIVDINSIPDLDYHRIDPDGTIRIGALCRHEDLEKSEILTKFQPVLAAAAPLVADPIVRTRGTFVGSVCHADPQGDWAATMVALDGFVIAMGPKGTRQIAIKDFVHGPFQNALEHNEIVIEAVIPAPLGVAHGGYLKLERRVGDFATASVAVAVDIDRGVVTRAGIALAGVGGSTISASEGAAALVGAPLSESAIAKASELTAAAAQPRSDHRGSADYKRQIVKTFVSRILTKISAEQKKEAA